LKGLISFRNAIPFKVLMNNKQNEMETPITQTGAAGANLRAMGGITASPSRDKEGFWMELEKLKETTDRHKILKNETLSSVVKIEAELLKGARNYFDTFGFTEVVVPHITRATGACENIDTMFGLDYFGERSYLVQTGQLYLESLIPRLGKVFCVGPSFRAEPEVDGRHLTEFTLVEIELPCDFDQLLEHTENIFHHMTQRIVHFRKQEIERFGIDKKRLDNMRPPFRKLRYSDAIEILKGYNINIIWGDDLKSSHEKKLVEHFGNKPLFITHFPEAIKFFNMRRNEEDSRLVNSADLILPYSGEAVGAAEREYEHDILKEKLAKSAMMKRLVEKGGSIKDFEWYLEHVKSGIEPHAGCGIGLNRVTQSILGIDDIRASTAFPMNKQSLM